MRASIVAYREFYDVPRSILLEHRGKALMLDSPFDETLDEYSPTYAVFVLRKMPAAASGCESWRSLILEKVGEIPVASVVFDPTKRKSFDPGVLDNLGSS